VPVQAGTVLRVSPGQPWYAAFPEELWGDVDVSSAVRRLRPGTV
jgi:hypothetical protein